MSANFKQGEEQRLRRETLQSFFEASKVLFQINAEAMPPLEDLPYLGRPIAYNNSNWPAIYQNLMKARSWWRMIARVLVKMRAMVQARGMMYNEVHQ